MKNKQPRRFVDRQSYLSVWNCFTVWQSLFVCYPLLFLQLSFSENGHYGSSEEKEKVAETRQMCYGKGI